VVLWSWFFSNASSPIVLDSIVVSKIKYPHQHWREPWGSQGASNHGWCLVCEGCYHLQVHCGWVGEMKKANNSSYFEIIIFLRSIVVFYDIVKSVVKLFKS
jgi:hypothetical protein